MSDKNSILLEVDPTLMDNNLLINKDDSEIDTLQSLLNAGYEKDGKLVQPLPGFCIKTWKENSDEKLFINICHTTELPKPNDISDKELLDLFKSAQEGADDFDDTKFRIPMSIASLHKDTDKGGHPCDVCDVAVNSDFFTNKVSVNYLFKSFLVTVALEGVCDKYSIDVKREKEPIILKNCKSFGKIQSQMIQNRSKTSSGNLFENSGISSSSNQKKLIEEISNSHTTSVSHKSPVSMKTPSSDSTSSLPYQMLIDPESAANKSKTPSYLTVNILVRQAGISRSKELILDLGEDRLLLRAASPLSSSDNIKKGDSILLDVFLPYNVDQKASTAKFNSGNKILTITMPVAG